MKRLGLFPRLEGKILRASFEHQVEAQLPMLFRVASGLVNQPADAEDLVHDACVKAILNYEKADFDDSVQFQAWLRRILVNTYRDYYRRTQRSPIKPAEYHAASGDSVNVIEMVASTDLSPFESIQTRHSSSAIHHAFTTLPPEVRVVAVLFLVSGLSYREIADITECPIGTVMSRLSRGRQLLRKQLAEFDPRRQEAAAE